MVDESDIKFTDRERRALLEDLRSEFSTPLDVIVGYSEILSEEFSVIEEKNKVASKKLKIKKCASDLRRILEEGKELQRKVDEAFEFAGLESNRADFNLAGFIRDLHHTLLTPLNSIIGYSELLWENGFTSLGEQFDYDLKRIYDAAQLFIGYINEIANVAKTQFEGGDLSKQFNSMSKIIRSVVSSIPPLEQRVGLQPTKEGTVLIIDDNEMELDLLKRRVEYYGYKAIPCNRASEAMNYLEKYSVDLILLQIIMADISGFEILKQIKKHEKFRHLPIIVMSPLKELDAIVRCFELGVDDYLSKPFNSVIFKARVNDCIEKKHLRDKEKEYLTNLTREKERSEELLLNILPASIAERLRNGEEFIADRMDSGTVLFIDIVNSSSLAEELSPQRMIFLLNEVFSIIDQLIDRYNVEKIKTIGDGYMAAAGITTPNKNHADSIARVALETLEALRKMNRELDTDLKLRIGINSGPVVAGIIGVKRFGYDLWGTTVNLASRMESQGVPDKIQVSEATYNLLKDSYEFTHRGTVNVRGIGDVNTYFLEGIKQRKNYKKKDENQLL